MNVEEEVIELIQRAAQEGVSSLDLSHKGLTLLPPSIGMLTNLRELYLENNQLRSLPPELMSLTSLRRLNLENNQIASLPPSIASLINLKELKLRGNPLPIPPEILALDGKPSEIISYHLRTLRDEERAPLNEAKLIVCGNGGVGKTSLLQRLIHERMEVDSGTTLGLSINDWMIEAGREHIRLNVWDFGGQVIFHALHPLLLTRRSLYLLVTDARIEDQSTGIEYWLELIQAFGGASPVIIVNNKSDLRQAGYDLAGLPRKYPNIRAIIPNVSAATGAGVDEVRDAIEREVSQLGHVQDTLPERWLAVKQLLGQTELQYVNYKHYELVCQSEGLNDPNEQATLLRLLHDLGDVIWFGDDPQLRETVILAPRWMLDAVYRILDSKEVVRSQGIVPVALPKRLLAEADYPTDTHDFILTLMERFEIGFALKGGREFLLPHLLPAAQPEPQWRPDDALVFRYRYDFLPRAIISRFIVRAQRLTSNGTYWRNGVILRGKENDALVEADTLGRYITLYVSGRPGTRRRYLRRIREQFDLIHKTFFNLAVQQEIPVPNYPEQFIDYQYLLTFRRLGRETFISPVSAEEISVRLLLEPYGGGEDEGADKGQIVEVTESEDVGERVKELPQPSFFLWLTTHLRSSAARLFLALVATIFIAVAIGSLPDILSSTRVSGAPLSKVAPVLAIAGVILGALLTLLSSAAAARSGDRAQSETFGQTFLKVIRLYFNPSSTDVALDLGESRSAAWMEQAQQSLLTTNRAGLSHIPKRQRKSFGEQFIRESKHLNLFYDREAEALKVSERSRLDRFKKAWEEAERLLDENRIEPFRAQADKLTEGVCEAVNFCTGNSRSTLGQFYGRMVDASSSALSLDIRDDFPFIFAAKKMFRPGDVQHAAGLLTYFSIHSKRFALLVAFSNAEQLRQVFRESIHKNEFIVLDHDQLWEVLAAKSSVIRLKDFILEQIDLTVLSPYTQAGAVSGKSFFGREEEEKMILGGITEKNYALLANRRMGKSSLLNKIVPLLRRSASLLVIFCDLQSAVDYESFYETFYESLEEAGVEVSGIIAPPKAPAATHFTKLIRSIKDQQKGRQVVIVFDEVDELLKYDLDFGERLFKTFRSLYQQERVRFIFSGTSVIVKRVHHPKSPFFNFCEEIRVGPLSESAAQDLVVVPMRELNIKFEDEAGAVRRILGMSARLPNVIHWVCDRLIRRLNEEQRRCVLRSDLDAVLSSEDFYNFFSDFIWGEAKLMPHLRLIVYAMWQYPDYTVADVRKEFAARGIPTEGVADALKVLEIYSILTRDGDRLRFTYQEFRGVLETHEDIYNLFEVSREETLKGVQQT